MGAGRGGDHPSGGSGAGEGPQERPSLSRGSGGGRGGGREVDPTQLRPRGRRPVQRASVSPSALGGEEQRRWGGPRDSGAAGSPAATVGTARFRGQDLNYRQAGNVSGSSTRTLSLGRSRSSPSRSESPGNHIIAGCHAVTLDRASTPPSDRQPSACRPPPPSPEGPPAAAGSLGQQAGGADPRPPEGGTCTQDSPGASEKPRVG